MRSNQYKQIIYTTLYLSGKINLKEKIDEIDEIRNQHSELQNKLELLLVDPFSYENPENRENIKSIAVEIKENCKLWNIQVNFIKLPEKFIDFSKQFSEERKFASYSYQNIDITRLIVFVKKKVPKKDKPKKVEENLGEIDFEEDMNAKSFITTPDNDLPELDKFF